MGEKRRTLGIIVNPVAGIGGAVGLKGSDGPEIQRLAWERGARAEAPRRAEEALKALILPSAQVDIITCGGKMGETECLAAGLLPRVLPLRSSSTTTAQDTVRAACQMAEMGADLLLFAGGDGTARNIFEAVKDRVPVLGIPAGVKIHSAVFAKNPRCAGQLASRFLEGRISTLRKAEVLDIDEDAYRGGHVSAKLFGYMQVPFAEELVQRQKAGSVSESSALHAIGAEIADHMENDCYYVIGAGTTTKCITDYLGLKKTLLGVDVLYQRKLIAQDLSEQDLITLLKRKTAKIIITPIGGQGYLFGRGNQQLSSRVIQMIGKENIIVVATLQKIADLNGSPLFVDTGDSATNRMLSGFIRVITGYRQELIYSVRA